MRRHSRSLRSAATLRSKEPPRPEPPRRCSICASSTCRCTTQTTSSEPPPTATTQIEACIGADGMIWSSPMYQGHDLAARSRTRSTGCIAARLGREPPFLHEQGGRADQRRRWNPGPAGDQHDGVLGAARCAPGPFRTSIPVAAAFSVFDCDGPRQGRRRSSSSSGLSGPRSCASRLASPTTRRSQRAGRMRRVGRARRRRGVVI